MAQSGYTPISLYYSTTGGATPTAGNLTNGELAINITDGKLFYKNGSTVYTIASKATSATTGTNAQLLANDGSGGFSNVTVGTGLSYSGGTLSATSGGTVSSVAMSVPSFLSVTGSPITSSGTLAVSYSGTALPTANGGTGLTGFTAANNAIYSTSSSVLTAGTLPVAAGGTGSTTLAANNVLLGNGTSALQAVAPGTTGNVLTSNGTTWVSQAASGGAMTVTTYTAQSANVTLTSANANSIINFTLANDITVTMPDATTLTSAKNFTIKNNDATYGVSIYDAAGTYLFTLPPGTGNTIWASSVSTSAGEWTALDTIYDYLSQPNLSGLTYNGTTMNTGKNNVAPLSTSSFVMSFIRNNNLYLVVGTYSGGALSFGTPTVVSSYSGQSALCTLTSTSGIVCWTDTASGNFAKVFTISGTTITLGSLYSTVPVTSDNFVSISAMSSSTAAFAYAYAGNIYVQQLSVSGTTISAATTFANPVTDSSTIYFGVLALSSSSIVVYYSEGTNYYLKTIAGTLSGSTWTFGSANMDTTGSIYNAYAVALSSSSFAMAMIDGSTLYCKAYTVSGTTLTAGSRATALTSVGGNYPTVTAVSSSRVIVAYDGTGSSLYPFATTFSVIGTTCTPSGTAVTLNGNNSNTGLSSINVIGLQAPAVASPSASDCVCPFAIAACQFVNAFSVSGSTITPVTTNSVALGPSAGPNSYTNIKSGAAFNKTQFLHVITRTSSDSTRWNLTITLYNVSNTTVTAQSSVSIATAPSLAAVYSVVTLSPTTALVVYGSSSSYPAAVVITRSGNTISAGTPLLVDTGSTSFTLFSLTMLSSTTALFSYRSNTNTNIKNVVLTVSGTSVTAGSIASFNLYSAPVVNIYNCALSSNYVLLAAYVNSPATIVVGLLISGTTVSLVSSGYYASMGDGYVSNFEIKAYSSSQAVYAATAYRQSTGASSDSIFGLYYGQITVANNAFPDNGGYVSAYSTFDQNYHSTTFYPAILPTSSTSGVIVAMHSNTLKPSFLPYSYVNANTLVQASPVSTTQPSSQYQFQTNLPCMITLAEPAAGANFSPEGVLVAAEYAYNNNTTQINGYTFRKYNSKGAIK